MTAPSHSLICVPRHRSANLLNLLLAGLLSAGLAGCLIIPTPGLDSGETRTNISKKTPEQFLVGKTTRAELVLALGEPDAVTPDERKLAYRREKIAAIWLAGGGYSGAGGSIDTDRYLVAEFDAGGVLNKVEYTRHGLGSADPDKMLDTSAAATNLDPSVRLQARANWLAGVKDYKSPGNKNGVWVSGRLVLTDTELRFFSKGQLANEPAELVLPFAAIKEAKLERFFFSHLLVIYEHTGENHAFRVWGKASAGNDRETQREACEFLKSKINPAKP